VLHPASFRDPSSGVLMSGRSVLRFFRGGAIADHEHATASGLLSRLAASGLILPFERLEAGDPDAARLPPGSVGVRQERLPIVTYPYEWPFSMLRDAALLHLRVLADAIEAGSILKDGSAYNVQFIGPRPVFIDLGSFMRHEEGRPWAGYSQFSKMFLNPLLFASLTGVPYTSWLRGAAEGIRTADLERVLSLPQKLRRSTFIHVWLQSALQERLGGLSPGDLGKRPYLKRQALLAQVRGLERTIRGLRPPRPASGWVEYGGEESYTPEGRADKLAFVDRVLAARRPRTVHDIGSNTGAFSFVAERHSETVVASDSAHDVADALYLRSRDAHPRVLPLVLDAADPSPPQGWEGVERESFSARVRPDLVLALALVHHLRFGANVPLARIAAWLARSAPSGIVDFVPRTDPMVARLLRWRDDVFEDHERAVFERELAATARITEVHEIAGSGRTLYVFEPS